MLESIKCSTSGAYYLRGQWVPANAQAPAALAAAGVTAEQAGQAYKGTMAYGILTAHNTSGSDRDLRIRFDAIVCHSPLVSPNLYHSTVAPVLSASSSNSVNASHPSRPSSVSSPARSPA